MSEASPATTGEGLGGRWDQVMVPNYGTPSLLLVEGEGSRVRDHQGNEYIDLVAGVAVNSVGHRHPRVVAAVQEQLQHILHTSNLYANAPALDLAERLSERTHGHKALLVNSGTEANEAALKAVRRHAHATDRPDGVVLTFQGSFHGRTIGALAVTGQPHHQEGFSPLPGQIVTVPFNDAQALHAAFEAHDVVGVFAEFVQGEGGVVPMAPDVASALTDLCRDHDALLAADEVQTGVGRTGRFWAYEHHGVVPDIVTVAKGIGGGLPLGACMMRAEVAALLGPGSHGCTFGGNPLACAAGDAVLAIIDDEALSERAARVGAAARARLETAGHTVRGQGLLLGLPLDGDHAPDVVRAMQKRGFLVGQAGKNVVRLAPPLTVPEEDLAAGLSALEEVLSAVVAAPA